MSTTPVPLVVDQLIDDRRTRIIVCCGSGGVGKTTIAAAVGLRAAERGRHVVVLTVDPARRLAQSMGLTSLDNTPRPVTGIRTGGSRHPQPDGSRNEPGPAGEAGHGGHADDGGSMHAMMLDMKRTFDEIVESHADPDRSAQILANPFYQSLSSSFAGTQEYMAMEKLGQLRRADEWDLIVVDTPPSRSALDFLDAPQRLGRFLDGRLLRLLVAPAKLGGRTGLRVLNAGFGMVTGVVTKIIGGQLLRDVQTFVSAMDTMFGGFRERAEYTYRLLRAPGTAFLVIASPEHDALREASYFVERLERDGMPLAGLILNRVHRSPAARLSSARSLAAAETLQGLDDSESSALGINALRLHAERMRLAESERRLARRFAAAHPFVPVAQIPAQPDDVHDMNGLRVIGAAFASD
ncbi:MAG TPA: ArsA family ATPase [Streptosporangiaceae bacterium]|nr:ArsA family ATPase [Streptosporangiaceae bacterium]